MDYSGKIITKNPVEPSQTSAPGVWTLDQATQAVQGNNWPIAYVPNPISRSLRFNSADQPSLRRTPSTTTNRRTFTYSWWFKIGKQDGQERYFLTITDSNADAILLESGYKLRVGFFANTYRLSTTQVFRDPGAWYHGVVTVDTTDGTSSNRVKLYINGQRVTSFSTETYPTQNYDTKYNVSGNECYMGANGNPGDAIRAWDGYMTEVNFIDGQALDASYFGMTDPRTGAWIPKKYSGTYGTNGFYLNFSDNASTTALGTDYSGNSNTWTTNNFSVTAGSGNDSMTDVPTPWIPYNTTGDIGGVVRGNYCTLNPLDTEFTITNGNLDATQATANFYNGRSTFAVSSGKWYYEATISSLGSSSILAFGARNNTTVIGNGYIGNESGDVGINSDASTFYKNNGTGNTSVSGSPTPTSGQILQCALDMDNGKVWFGVNGTWLESGNPSTATNPMFTGLSGTKSPAISVYNSSAFNMNFGQRPFAYTPPAGFLSLCTTNLPEPTVLDGGDYMNAVLWTGNSSASQAVTGVGFQPDLVWAKSRPANSGQDWVDSVRGATKNIQSSSSAAETTSNTVISFQSDGFTVGDGNGYDINKSGESVVGWCWKAAGSTVSNTAGTITSTVSANQTAGFSIVTYTGTGANATVGHGLSSAPSFVICKSRNNTYSWVSYHISLGASAFIELNSTAAATTGRNDVWNATAPSSTVVSLGTVAGNNNSGTTYVAYCFAPIAGYSAFGSYTGNGSSDGPFVYTGFRPRFVMIKRTDSAASWAIMDSARSPNNAVAAMLYPNSTSAEGGSTDYWDFTSNGMKIRNSFADPSNASGGTYIYAAFAENPFKYSNAR